MFKKYPGLALCLKEKSQWQIFTNLKFTDGQHTYPKYTDGSQLVPLKDSTNVHPPHRLPFAYFWCGVSRAHSACKAAINTLTSLIGRKRCCLSSKVKAPGVKPLSCCKTTFRLVSVAGKSNGWI